MSEQMYETTTQPNLLRRFDPDFAVYEYVLMVPATEHVTLTAMQHLDVEGVERMMRKQLAHRLGVHMTKAFLEDR